METINRREALKRTSLMMGGALSSSLIAGVLSGYAVEQNLDWTPIVLTPNQTELVDDLTERILPATSTPGAREAKVVRFIDQMVAEYLEESDRKTFFKGLDLLGQRGFRNKAIDGQNQLVSEMVKESRAQDQTTEGKPFFPLFKELTLLGFFTSEVGATQVLNYDPIPGSYQGCISLEEAGGKRWAN